jgi:hypothetical protein
MHYVLEYVADKAQEVHKGVKNIQTLDGEKLSAKDIKLQMHVLAKWKANSQWYEAVVQKISDYEPTPSNEDLYPKTNQQLKKMSKVNFLFFFYFIFIFIFLA